MNQKKSKSTKAKTFVLDTNVLAVSPYAIHSFDEHNVAIADITMEELDNLKTRPGETGANAREVIRMIEKLRQEGDLAKGVQLPMGGGLFHIEMNHLAAEIPSGWDQTKPDNRILRVCKGLLTEGKAPILVSNDTTMRIKAGLIGIPAEEYKTEQVKSVKEQYKGRSTVYVKPEAVGSFYKKGYLAPDDIVSYVGDEETEVSLTKNEFLLLVNIADPKNSALGRFDGTKIVPLEFEKATPYDVHPRNVGQRFAQEALMASAEDAPLVILKGPAGTAKTFYSLAVGLERVVNEGKFDRILIARSNTKFDDDIGFLPGEEKNKVGALCRGFADNISGLTKMQEKSNKGARGPSQDNYADLLFERGFIVAEAMAYMRGRSITDTWIIIDEAQNMTPTQAFGIISRAGVGSKIILIGDPDQIDNPKLDSRTNGLSFASERMKGSSLCWQTTFSEEECTRSELAAEAITRLSPKGYAQAID